MWVNFLVHQNRFKFIIRMFLWHNRWLDMILKNVNFGQFFVLIFSIRLIRGSTYMRVYTVNMFLACKIGDLKKTGWLLVKLQKFQLCI